MTKEKIQSAMATGDYSKLIDGLSCEIQDRWEDIGAEALNRPQTVILAISTFIGQVCSGGMMHYVGTRYGEFLPRLKDCFHESGISDYDELLDRTIHCFGGDVPDEADDRWERAKNIRVSFGATIWDELDQRFFAIYHDRGKDEPWIDRMLAQYVSVHIDAVATG